MSDERQARHAVATNKRAIFIEIPPLEAAPDIANGAFVNANPTPLHFGAKIAPAAPHYKPEAPHNPPFQQPNASVYLAVAMMAGAPVESVVSQYRLHASSANVAGRVPWAPGASSCAASWAGAPSVIAAW